MQPKPRQGQQKVTEAVIRDFRARSRAGKKTYGRVLETFNGRSALTDLYEELQDAVQYLKQHMMEMEHKSVGVTHNDVRPVNGKARDRVLRRRGNR